MSLVLGTMSLVLGILLECTVLDLTEKIVMASDSSQKCLRISLDLAKAFGTAVDTKLSNKYFTYGIREPTLLLLEDYSNDERIVKERKIGEAETPRTTEEAEVNKSKINATLDKARPPPDRIQDPYNLKENKFLQIDEVKNKMKQASETLPKKIIITNILMSLPDKYKHSSSAWGSVPGDKPTLRELTSRFLIEEERAMPLEKDTALAVSTSKMRDSMETLGENLMKS
ncbi:hypothetical protein JTB14_037332 [Gonioctena quinquepunctata]|nr:hypothetical protein JTB14_037332 [Gonioctena quinquepunctata]